MSGGLLELAHRSVPIVAREDQVLRNLREPLLDEGCSIGLCAVELVLRLLQAAVVELHGPQRLEPGVRRTQKIEPRFIAVLRECIAHALDLAGDAEALP